MSPTEGVLSRVFLPSCLLWCVEPISIALSQNSLAETVEFPRIEGIDGDKTENRNRGV